MPKKCHQSGRGISHLSTNPSQTSQRAREHVKREGQERENPRPVPDVGSDDSDPGGRGHFESGGAARSVNSCRIVLIG